ncbi:MAG: hypothetical protein JO004_09495 [Methylobacteriaceae bacterium]|nr:hypothetical protein [Methylobacteriaceae bacterium]
MNENTARVRAHQNNINRYRRLLATELTDLERAYILKRLRQEETALNAFRQAVLSPEAGLHDLSPQTAA